MLPSPSFWSKQRVLLTGHTGFKGSWAALWLEHLGAEVHGFALPPAHVPDLYSHLAPFRTMRSTLANLNEGKKLAAVVAELQPTIVLHMAAQPLVRRSYADPVETFETNVMGTARLLEAVREVDTLSAILVVTTDKVYRNEGDPRSFVEDDRLGGHDPYSASKACTELVTSCYAHSFFVKRGVPVATARAGNVVGGGDWSDDRIVPDIWRALHAQRPLELRYPKATRPWQHVLDPLAGYLVYIERLASRSGELPSALNFGPADSENKVTVAEVAEMMSLEFGVQEPWRPAAGFHPPEMTHLALDSGAAMRALEWRPRLTGRDALRWTAHWYRQFDAGVEVRPMTLAQITAYEALS